MIKKIILFLLILLVPIFINAKELKLEWQKKLSDTMFDSVIPPIYCGDDIYVLGESDNTNIDDLTNNGKKDIIIAKYDKNENIIWKKNWGGNLDETIYSAIVTKDNGVIFVGHTSSTNIEGLTLTGEYDAIVVKYDKEGNLEWQRNFGGSNYEYFTTIQETQNDQLILTGSIYESDIEGLEGKGKYDAFVLKYDINGEIVWKSIWGESKDDYFLDSYLDKDENMYAIGYTFTDKEDGDFYKGRYDTIIVKYDKDGKMLWQKSWGGTGDDPSATLIKGKTFDINENGEIIIARSSNSTDIEGIENRGSTDAVILKYDKDGNLLKQVSWGGSNADNFTSVKILDNGEIIVSGFSRSEDIEGIQNKGYTEAFIIKYNNNFDPIWIKSWGGSSIDEFDYLFILKDGSIIALGWTLSKDIEGLISENSRENVVVKYSYEYILDVKETKNGLINVLQQSATGIITPTPDKGYEVDKIIVKDSTGKEISTTKQEDGTYTFELYDDVTIETTFKEELVNPKTGNINYGLLIKVILMFSLLAFGYISVYRKNKVL